MEVDFVCNKGSERIYIQSAWRMPDAEKMEQEKRLCNVDYASMELLHARLVRTTTCVDGCRCDYTICGDKDPYLKEHPEYRDEAGFRRNK